MTRSYTKLPEGYSQHAHINLQTDKKTALRVNIAAVIIMLAMFILAHFAIAPITTLFDPDADDLLPCLLRVGVLLLGYFAYIILHELTHAAVMKLFGAKKLRFGFTGLYAFAGSEEDYFDKLSYILVALAPLIVWGIIFTPALILIPRDWFWVVWFWQVGNIAGSAGDLYVVGRTAGMPSDILVRDTGVEMFVYSRQ